MQLQELTTSGPHSHQPPPPQLSGPRDRLSPHWRALPPQEKASGGGDADPHPNPPMPQPATPQSGLEGGVPGPAPSPGPTSSFHFQELCTCIGRAPAPFWPRRAEAHGWLHRADPHSDTPRGQHEHTDADVNTHRDTDMQAQ